VINNAKYPTLEAAYLYYYGTETAFTSKDDEKSLQKRLMSLIGDALVVATEANFDVFNALTLMDNVPILKDLKVNFRDPLFMLHLLFGSSLKETASSTFIYITGEQLL